MFVYILDKNFLTVGVVDTFESMIWTDRYRENGDLSICCFPDQEIINISQIDYYVVNPQSEHLMIIEGREIDTDAEDGNRFIITGRSLESILDRRVVWTQTSISGSLQTGIKKLITDAFIKPSVGNRKVSNFIFKDSTDSAITSLTVDAQYTGDNLYDIVTSLCEENDIGFKITLNDSNQFVFELYKGENRSYSQNENTYVTFSPNYDNIINSQYAETVREYKNVALVGGEGEGTERKYLETGSGTGVLRREVFVDARDAVSKKDDDSTMTDEEYNSVLKERGDKSLSETKWAKTFEGEVDATNGFVYGTDFFLGDTVQVANEYGMEGPSLVTEIIWAQDDEGYRCYPTFVSQNDDEEETTNT